MYQYLGLVAVLIGVASVAFILSKWKGSYTMSISQHVASTTIATRFFASLLLLVGTVFYVWMITWFVDTLQLSDIFIALATAVFVCQTVAASVPDRGTKQSIIHRLAAYAMAALYLPTAYLVVSSNEISQPAQLVGHVGILYMIVAIILFFAVKKSKEFYLVFQGLYVLAFFVLILAAAYLR